MNWIVDREWAWKGTILVTTEAFGAIEIKTIQTSWAVVGLKSIDWVGLKTALFVN